VNLWVAPVFNVTLLGETVTLTSGGGGGGGGGGAALVTVTADVPTAAGTATLAACTVTFVGDAGAVYRPAGLIQPVTAFPPTTPLTLHVTPGFEEF
jgi:hypothetical protein